MKNKRKVIIYCTAASFALAVVLLLFFFIGLYTYGKNNNATFDEDAVIVLGAGIYGERVSLLLSYRLDEAAEYSFKNPDAIVVVSGGQGPNEFITEAEAMERYLLNAGVPAERIIKEELSTNTYENLLFSQAILNRLFDAEYRVVIITSDFHTFRAIRSAKRLGLDTTHIGAETDLQYVPYNYSRECAAIVKSLLTGR